MRYRVLERDSTLPTNGLCLWYYIDLFGVDLLSHQLMILYMTLHRQIPWIDLLPDWKCPDWLEWSQDDLTSCSICNLQNTIFIMQLIPSDQLTMTMTMREMDDGAQCLKGILFPLFTGIIIPRGRKNYFLLLCILLFDLIWFDFDLQRSKTRIFSSLFSHRIGSPYRSRRKQGKGKPTQISGIGHPPKTKVQVCSKWGLGSGCCYVLVPWPLSYIHMYKLAR